MRIVLATSNKGKVEEIKKIMEGFSVVPYTDLLESFEIEEHGSTFKENAIIKAETIYNTLGDTENLVLSDDSGISIVALDNAPGIYSARYARIGASDKENLDKAVTSLKEKGLQESKAFYTCAIAIASKYGTFSTHGYMHGKVIVNPRGSNGFGYDPMFVPSGYEETLGELPWEIKKSFSHRSRALDLARLVLLALS